MIWPFSKRKTPVEEKPGCPQHGEDFLIEVTSLGDTYRKFVCGKCGWKSDAEAGS